MSVDAKAARLKATATRLIEKNVTKGTLKSRDASGTPWAPGDTDALSEIDMVPTKRKIAGEPEFMQKLDLQVFLVSAAGGRPLVHDQIAVVPLSAVDTQTRWLEVIVATTVRLGTGELLYKVWLET